MTSSDNEFQDKVIAAFKVAPVRVRADTFSWKPIEKSPVTTYLRFFGERVVVASVRLPHDAARVDRFLQELTAAQLESVDEGRPVALLASAVAAEQGAAYRRAMVHPTVAKVNLNSETAFMGAAAFRSFPAHRSEFCADDPPDEVRYRITKIISVSTWDRAPSPALSARWRRIATGVGSTGGKRLGIIALDAVQKIIGYLAKEEGFLEVENFLHERIKIENEKGAFRIAQADESKPIDGAKVAAWFDTYALDGLAAAEATR